MVCRRKRIAGVERQVKAPATGPNQSWSMDFVFGGLVDGPQLRCLKIVDDFTKECLAIEVDTTLPGRRVVGLLERLAELQGLPQSVTVDNGPEFVSRVLDRWAYEHGVKLPFWRSGKPTDNAHVEAFNRRLRQECLNQHWLLSLHDTRAD